LGVARVWKRLRVRTYSAADFSSFLLIVNGGFQLSHLRVVEQKGWGGWGKPNNLQLEFFWSRILNAGHFQNSLQDFQGNPRTNTLRKFLEAFFLSY
jgi:hypothetical protein